MSSLDAFIEDLLPRIEFLRARVLWMPLPRECPPPQKTPGRFLIRGRDHRRVRKTDIMEFTFGR